VAAPPSLSPSASVGAWAVEAGGCTLLALAACSICGATETAEDRMLLMFTEAHAFKGSHIQLRIDT
jgi:hypothetical protein